MYELVTLEEFINQVWEVEHVKIQINKREGYVEHLVRPYNFESLPDTATVDDLKLRINECLNRPFVYMI